MAVQFEFTLELQEPLLRLIWILVFITFILLIIIQNHVFAHMLFQKYHRELFQILRQSHDQTIQNDMIAIGWENPPLLLWICLYWHLDIGLLLKILIELIQLDLQLLVVHLNQLNGLVILTLHLFNCLQNIGLLFWLFTQISSEIMHVFLQ